MDELQETKCRKCIKTIRIWRLADKLYEIEYLLAGIPTNEEIKA